MLLGTQVQLRPLEPDDLPFLTRLENDPALWDVGDTRMPYSRYALEQYIERAAVEDIYSVRQARFVIAAALRAYQAYGVIDLFELAPAHRRAGVGIALLPEARGQRFGSEALQLLCEYAAEVLHLRQLHCCVAANNEPSLRLFRRAGFTEVGVRRAWLLGRGEQWHDAVELQLLF